MKYRELGKTGITVSEICFGGLTVGPLQCNLTPEDGGAVIAHAISRGINFVDTAQVYRTYSHLREGLRLSGKFDTVISTKTFAYTREQAEEAFEEARRELDRDVIDIFLLHEHESIHTLRGHKEALDFLYSCKAKGTIRAVGASMHHIAAVEGAVTMGLDVIHPLINREGLGILDGTREQMEAAIKKAHDCGMGVFAMKPLGGGNLFSRAEECLTYARSLEGVDSVAIGMQSADEVDANIHFFESGAFSPAQRKTLDSKQRTLLIQDWCEGCGQCVDMCPQGALTLEESRAVCKKESCILCGYCGAKCPALAIKVI